MSIWSRIPFLANDEGSSESSKSSSGNSRPPKPEPREVTDTENVDRYEITVTYTTGETESFETHSYHFGERVLSIYDCSFEVQPSFYAGRTHNMSAKASLEVTADDEVTVPYETLAERPTIEKIGTTTVAYRYTTTHEWEHSISRLSGFNWNETVDETEVLSVSEGGDGDDV